MSADGFPVLCLSDGAGGARFAELASRGNVDAVLNYFQNNKAEAFMDLKSEIRAKVIIDECVSYLKNVAARYQIDNISDLSATLVFVILTDKHIYVGHIGDGVVAAMSKSDDFKFLSEPENIDGATNRTHFTCEYKAENNYNESVFDTSEFSSILLCSDGPYNDISVLHDLQLSFKNLLSEVEDGVINNEIDFNRRVSNIADISDDWSIIDCLGIFPYYMSEASQH